MKQINTLIIIIALILTISTSIALVSIKLAKNEIHNELIVDLSNPVGEITHGATGFLYGIAEPDIPNGNLLKGIQPKVLATRVPNGLQHPSGDIAQVQKTFFENGGKNAIIYMQDIYPDWYYSYRSDYLVTMSEVLDSLVSLEYSDRFIYQPFNEMNNGVWYGDFNKKENRFAFYEAYKNAYNLIKEKTGGAAVGGPAYTDYNHNLIKEFLEYTIQNDCVPDVMIWHELSWYSTYGLKDNVKDYRNLETELGISKRRIIIDEYGTFKDIGTPGNLVQYISSFEESETEGCLAFWRIPNNLNDLAASNNMPTSAWWLYNWYGNMEGNRYYTVKSQSTFHNFSGLTSIDKEKITIICGGTEGKSQINLQNISSLPLFKNAHSYDYTVEYLDFNGLSTPSLGGIEYIKGSKNILNDNIIELGNLYFARAYKIEIYPRKETLYLNKTTLLDTPTRYQAEDAKYNAEIISYDDVRYASSGSCVKISEEYQNLEFKIDVAEDGFYRLDLIYACAPKIGNSVLNGRVKFTIDERSFTEILKNTLTLNSSTSHTLYKYFQKGQHIITIQEDFGDVLIDFLDVQKVGNDIESFNYNVKTVKQTDNKYLLVTKKSGYYNIETYGRLLKLNDINIESNTVYLNYGINYLTVENVDNLKFTYLKNEFEILYPVDTAIGAEPYVVENEFSPTSIFALNVGANVPLTFNVEVNKSGYYALKTYYSYSEIYGSHSYNEKLVERYAVVTINGNKIGTLYYQNTYSNFNFSEHITYVYLNKGKNTVTYCNDASYVWNGISPKLPNIGAISVNYIG